MRMIQTMTRTKIAVFGSLLVFAIVLSACGSSEPEATPTVLPSPSPSGPTSLNICTIEEPDSLYLYDDQSQSAQAIRQAIYDGPFDSLSYKAEGAIFESTPSLENGGALIQTVSVQAGDSVVDADGQISILQSGVRLRPAGCRSGDCEQSYSGGEFQMDQLEVSFQLVESLTWSDGTAVTAADSVYSFNLNADAETPASKDKVAHTASYVATSERSAVWTGLPGYLDQDFMRNFWTPLPQHAWSNLSAADLRNADAATRTPLSYGPYLIEEWTAGEAIHLSRNPHYWRSAEGLPFFNALNIIFLGHNPIAAIQALADGSCDLLLPSASLEEAEEPLFAASDAGELRLYFGPSGSWFHLDFGIQPLSYDDGYNPVSDRPNYFGDAAIRRAVAQCMDREAIVDRMAWAHGGLPNAYLDAEHEYAYSDATNYIFYPIAANEAFSALGWEEDANGRRIAQNVTDVPAGTPFQLQLTTSNEDDTLQMAAIIQSSLDDCGIDVEIVAEAPGVIFAPGPDGPLFGRNFDLGLFAWPLSQQPACFLYMSNAIPGEDINAFPYGWGGWNLSGWSNPGFDAACQRAMNALPGEAEYADAHAEAQAIFAAELPALPLYLPQQIAVSRPDFCGFNLAAGRNLLQGIEGYGIAEWCD
jgi:peptide/nickel transport system substrate-binding protein